MLRDPVSRFLSEWKHVQRGATWKTSLHMCDGRSPTQDELPTCYLGDDWSGVTLQEFMDCTYNLANNRQVRMLADLSLVGCYNLSSMNESERNEILLRSAKDNLKNMAFFGLTEYQRKTQYLFERTFNLKFISPFTQLNSTRAANVDIEWPTRRRIEELNFLDMQLYEYAKDLFLQRFQFTRQRERQLERQRRREERQLLHAQKAHHYRQQADDSVTTEDYTGQVARWNFYYITMLRDPVSRFLSEWKHVQRGATWKTSLHMCDGRSPTQDELPTCYLGDDWSGVTLQEFMDCTYNLANNRQVRMLADLSLVGCYNLSSMNESERNEILLRSAKDNLKNMAFFGLTEYQRKTQYLFERTFNLNTRAANVDIEWPTRRRIEELNFLDMQLYEYAKDLFLQRFQFTRQRERQLERQRRREERQLLHAQKAHHYRQQADDSVTTEDYTGQVARW
ncbi:UNVERIFIED_CONTAM: hypothetical protein FKN15_036657 [Acipenser sinensis]